MLRVARTTWALSIARGLSLPGGGRNGVAGDSGPLEHVGAFDFSQLVFRSPWEPPPAGPLPDAALRGLSLTPEGSQLVATDFGAQSVYPIHSDGVANNGVKIPVGGVSAAALGCTGWPARHSVSPRRGYG